MCYNRSPAKTGLIGFTRVLAAEGATHNIKVNAIAPIACTRMPAHFVNGAGQQADPSARAVLDDLGGEYLRKLNPAPMAPAVAFLAHRDCPITGEIYTAGAGHVARFFIGRTNGFTAPHYLSRMCALTSKRFVTRPATPCPAGPPTRWASSSQRLSGIDMKQ